MYSDPFKINAAIMLAKARGLPGPTVFVWGGDVLRLTDKIPKRLLGEEMRKLRNKGGMPFYDITDLRAKLRVIRERTFWGHYLECLKADKQAEESVWAEKLYKRLKYFLEGRHDPFWNKGRIIEIYGSRNYNLRSGRSRGLRLLQLLLTIDGIFQQRYLAFPEEAWTWQKFDLFTLGHISLMLGDEFLDGDLENIEILKHKTAYAQIKMQRQIFKKLAGRGLLTLDQVDQLLDRADPLTSVSRVTWTRYLRMDNTLEKVQVQGILAQTRCAGTPPPLVGLQSKVKCLGTLVIKPGPFSMELELIAGAMRNILSSLPDAPFTGLTTKAGLRATISACYEKTRAEGGTMERISEIVSDGTIGRQCHIVDLNDCSYVEAKDLNMENPAEYIFWRCLEDVLATPPEELRKVFLVLASEPGKARSVTKGAACLKIVLDVVNAICSWPMHKAFPSSTSGMSKEAHGWNFFSSMFTEDLNDLVFREKQVTKEREGEDIFYKTTLYHDVYVISTDYETATDFLRHDVAEVIGTAWMTKCGIPDVLQGIVVETCYRPRRVEFTAKGLLKTTGKQCGDNINYIISERGVMMGDPLTKVVLHLLNIGVRELASKITDYQWLSMFCSNAAEVIEQLPIGEVIPPVERLVI
jgi:hypothetical protein